MEAPLRTQPRKILQDVGSVILAPHIGRVHSVLIDCMFAEDKPLPFDVFYSIVNEQYKLQNRMFYDDQNCRQA